MSRLTIAARILRELLRGPDVIGKRLEALQRIANLLVPGYRLTWPHSDWWSDECFNRYLTESGEINGLNMLNRMMLAELLRLVHETPGDTAECGVFTGNSSQLICLANQASSLPKCHHMFDSFEGVSEPTQEDGEHWTKGDLSCGLERVKQRLSSFDQVEYYPGWIPSRFDAVANSKFSFVHLDVDLYEPTRHSISFFYPRMSDGGIILCDDFGSGVCPGATKACNEFLADKIESMISLPAAGGFFIKSNPTGPKYWKTNDA